MSWTTVKKWLVPLARTFLATFLAAVIAGLTSVTSVPAIWPFICAAAVAGLNAVLIAVQTATPGVPTPVPPTTTSS